MLSEIKKSVVQQQTARIGWGRALLNWKKCDIEHRRDGACRHCSSWTRIVPRTGIRRNMERLNASSGPTVPLLAVGQPFLWQSCHRLS